MWMRKRAFVEKETIELLLAAGAVVVLVLLFFRLLTPEYNVAEETAEAYLKLLKEQINFIDSGTEGSFNLWLPQTSEGISYYLVYFDDKLAYSHHFSEGYVDFSYLKSFGRKVLCICYREEQKTFCNECISLKSEARLVGDDGGPWAVGMGERVRINLEGENYVFSKIE